MTPAQLHAWSQRLDCALADFDPQEAEPLRLLYSEMALALVACYEREERLVSDLARHPRVLFASDPDVRSLVGLEERVSCRRGTLPAEGIASLLRRKTG